MGRLNEHVDEGGFAYSSTLLIIDHTMLKITQNSYITNVVWRVHDGGMIFIRVLGFEREEKVHTLVTGMVFSNKENVLVSIGAMRGTEMSCSSSSWTSTSASP